MRLGTKKTLILRYIIFFSTTTLVPAIIIAIFSLVLFNLTIQQYFNKKIKSIVHNSREVALNYVEETRNTIESDILLMLIDIDKKSTLFYENPQNSTQRSATSFGDIGVVEGAKLIYFFALFPKNELWSTFRQHVLPKCCLFVDTFWLFFLNWSTKGNT